MRNPFGLAFDPKTGHLYQTENGASNCDEINVVIRGGFYGHPQSMSDAAIPKCIERPGNRPVYLPHKPGMEPETFGSNAAPVGIDFAVKSIYPSLGDALVYCEFNTRQMRRLTIIEDETIRVADDAVIADDCNLDVTTSPDGSIYYSNFWEIRRLEPGPRNEYPISDVGAQTHGP
jgi:glucose/arabinose dehydrogenase